MNRPYVKTALYLIFMPSKHLLKVTGCIFFSDNGALPEKVQG